MPPDTILTGKGSPSAEQRPLAVIGLTYRTAAEVGRDRLPQLPNGLLARTQAAVENGELVEVVIEAKAEGITVRACGEVRWMTRLATSRLVGMVLTGATPEDRDHLERFLEAPSGIAAAMTPTLTPALRFAPAPVLSVAMLQPNVVLRQILSGALEKVAGKLGERWTLKLDACATAESFLASMASRQRQLAVIDCDAVGGAEEALVDAIRAHDGYARLPLVLLSGLRTARLEDPFAVTMQKPLTVKSFLHTTQLLLRA